MEDSLMSYKERAKTHADGYFTLFDTELDGVGDVTVNREFLMVLVREVCYLRTMLEDLVCR